MLRGITSRIDTIAQNVTRVANVMDGGGTRGESDEADSYVQANAPDAQGTRPQREVQFLDNEL